MNSDRNVRGLVIDDEAPIRLLCRVNLEAEQMDVLEASDGPTGLEKARNGEPDVILLDGVERLRDVVDPAEVEPTRAVARLGAGCQEDDRDGARSVVADQLLGDLPPVEPGHHHEAV